MNTTSSTILADLTRKPVETNVDRAKRQPSKPTWVRLVAAIATLVVGSVLGLSVYIFGMLMFMFSLDSATANQIPEWLELYMLIGWPCIITLAVVVPPIFIAVGAKRRWTVISLIDGAIAVAAWWFVGVVVAIEAMAG